ncbi:MAG: periplasmic heavy metal sensor [Myxococcales bacterium]|nr:periplasmic heavy metal sensor [Myxococcales bacterium]
MKLKRTVIALFAGIGLLASAGGAYAFWHRGGHGPRLEKMKKYLDFHLNDVLDDLEADQGQRDRVFAVKDQLVKSAEQVFESRGELRTALLGQWNAEKPDAAAVHRLIDDRIDELRALAHQAADAGLELHGVLTPKQRAAVSEKISDRFQR